jgi:predicted ester cyclase
MVVAVYQQGADGRWTMEKIFSAGDRVVVRWTGSGSHVGELNGVPSTGKPIRVDAITIHRMADDKIAETWQVWDTLGLLQQIGVVPTSG